MAVQSANVNEMEFALWHLEGLYTGVALPLSAQNQTIWTVTKGKNAAPGSWGGHCIWIPKYASMLDVVTWGEELNATIAFIQKYCDEMFAVISVDALNGKGVNPLGENLAQLQADLAEVTG